MTLGATVHSYCNLNQNINGPLCTLTKTQLSKQNKTKMIELDLASGNLISQ